MRTAMAVLEEKNKALLALVNQWRFGFYLFKMFLDYLFLQRIAIITHCLDAIFDDR